MYQHVNITEQQHQQQQRRLLCSSGFACSLCLLPFSGLAAAAATHHGPPLRCRRVRDAVFTQSEVRRDGRSRRHQHARRCELRKQRRPAHPPMIAAPSGGAAAPAVSFFCPDDGSEGEEEERGVDDVERRWKGGPEDNDRADRTGRTWCDSVECHWKLRWNREEKWEAEAGNDRRA